MKVSLERCVSTGQQIHSHKPGGKNMPQRDVVPPGLGQIVALVFESLQLWEVFG